MKYYAEEAENEGKKPLRIIGALILVFMLLILLIPVYKIKFDPEPNHEKIPELSEITGLVSINNINNTMPLRSLNEILVIEDMPIIRLAAVKISADSCRESQICHAKALYYFTRDKIKYIEDPAKEYFQHPSETLMSGGGDCDDKTIFLAYLLKSIDVPSRICLTSNHAYIQAFLKEKWFSLDPTSQQPFGKIDYQHTDAICNIYI